MRNNYHKGETSKTHTREHLQIVLRIKYLKTSYLDSETTISNHRTKYWLTDHNVILYWANPSWERVLENVIVIFQGSPLF